MPARVRSTARRTLRPEQARAAGLLLVASRPVWRTGRVLVVLPAVAEAAARCAVREPIDCRSIVHTVLPCGRDEMRARRQRPLRDQIPLYLRRAPHRRGHPPTPPAT